MFSRYTSSTSTALSRKSARKPTPVAGGLARAASRPTCCEALELRRLLAASLTLGGAQTVVPGATIDASAFVNSPPSGDTAAGQSEMTLAVNPTNPLNLVGFSHRLASPILMNLYRSTDGG